MKKLIAESFFIFSFILISFTGVEALTISGKITDSTTGKEIRDVSIAIVELKAVTVTPADGSFYFENIPAGYYTLYTAHTLYGNKTIRIRVKRKFKLSIELSKTVHSIPVTNGYKTIGSHPGKQSISSDDIRYMPMSGAGDSLHLLQTLPGAGSTFLMGTVPIIRGLNPIYDKTYIDDIPVDYPYHYIPPIFPILSSINETIIDKATIFKGPYPMTYDDSIGSIIQIKTKEVQGPGVRGKIILNPVLPIFPTIYCEAAPTADFSLLFAGRRTYADLFINSMPIATPYDFYLQDHYLKLKYNISSQHRFYFTTLGSDDYLSIKRYEARTSYHVESIKWQYLISKNLFIESSVLRNRTEHYFSQKVKEGIPIKVVFSPLMYRFAQTFTADLSFVEMKTGYELIIHKDGISGNADISELLRAILAKDSGGAAAEFPIEGKTYSIFNETAVDLKPVRLNLGARYKYYGPLSTSTVSYRGIASYTIKKQNLKIYTGGGSYHAQPDMYYYLDYSRHGLKESKSYNGNFGVEKNLTRDITGQIEAYYAKYEYLFPGNFDKISSSRIQKFFQINPYLNDESGSAYGIEGFVKGNWGKIYGWASYSLSNSRMSDGENEYDSDYDQTHIFRLALLTHRGRWTPSIVWHYYTSMPHTPITGKSAGGETEYGEHNSERYPAQHRLDLKLSYTIDNTRFYAEIWNIYYLWGYNFEKKEAETNQGYLYPVLDKKKPYSDSNPSMRPDVPAFISAGVEICF